MAQNAPQDIFSDIRNRLKILKIEKKINEIMDEIRVVLRKYAVHFPDWEQEYKPDLNLDDQIYSLIHDEIKDALGRK